MLPTPEYSDLYKFLASIGLILIVVAVGLPWLFLRESFVEPITVAEMDELTSIGRMLVEPGVDA